MKNPVQTFFFSATSELTKYFPRLGAWLLDFPIRAFVGSHLISAIFSRLNLIKLRRVRSFKRFLVNPDIHLGDAIMAQSIVTALRDFFPNAEIDFVCNRSVMPLIESNPEINRFFPIYSGGAFPPDSELEKVCALIETGDYDLCVNSNPFLTANKLSKKSKIVFDVTTHAATLIRNENLPNEVNHFAFQYMRFVHGLLERIALPQRNVAFPGVTVGFSDNAQEAAAQFLQVFDSRRPLVLMNTDTASPYTRIPLDYQVELAVRLLQNNVSLLIGAGHSAAGFGQRLFDSIPSNLRDQVRLVPSTMSLEVYSALGDRCDLFITGDTGPMHIAAARKYSRTGKIPTRNRTALLCIFGATPARMSGYASKQPGYLPANQDAPSWTVVAGSPCRNITCLNKLFKTCQTVRCFEELDVVATSELCLQQLNQISNC